MPIAKGLSSGYLPIGGVMIGDRVAAVMAEKAGEFNHGFTYSGHPVACAVACAAINILRDERIVERVRDDVGPYLQQRWRELASSSAGGRGAHGRFDRRARAGRRTRPSASRLPRPRVRWGSICRDLCIANGLVMRAVRDTMIVAPPLVITHAQIDELVEKGARRFGSNPARVTAPGAGCSPTPPTSALALADRNNQRCGEKS